MKGNEELTALNIKVIAWRNDGTVQILTYCLNNTFFMFFFTHPRTWQDNATAITSPTAVLRRVRMGRLYSII
jgi:hypothetical protein